MTDGIATGWHHALWLLGYLIGLAPLLLAVGLLLVLAAPTAAWVQHRRSVAYVRRQQRRSGRSS